MSSYKKNLLVGLTVLVAMLLLGYMILRFGDAPARLFISDRIPVQLTVDRAPGVNDGSPVYYRGVSVGRVSNIHLSPDQAEVIINARIQADVSIPANVVGLIRTQGVIGASAAISLELPANQLPTGRLAANDKIAAQYIGLEVLPSEFTTLAQELTALSHELRQTQIINHTDEAIVSLKTQIDHTGKVLDSIEAIVADPQVQQNIKDSVDAIRQTSQSAQRITSQLEKTSQTIDTLADHAQLTLEKTNASIDTITAQLSSRLEQTSQILANIQSISSKIDQGSGSAGLLMNDPRLYQSLVESSNELTDLLKDARRLVQQWEQEGAALRLK